MVDADARDMMLLALCSGMRRGEILRLAWDDVDLERGFITIREPKGGTNQSIPLSTAARDILESRTRVKDCPFVFPGRKGGRRVDAAKQFRAIRDAAGLPKDFRPMHGLRHTFASHLASSGEVDLYTIQRLLTHKSPLMTQRYAHLRDETLRAASNLAGAVLTTKSGEQGREADARKARA
jgi:integrase